jgi:TolB-like protein
MDSIEAHAVIKGSVGRQEGKIIVQLKLFDPYERVMLLGKTVYSGVQATQNDSSQVLR